MNKEHPIIFSGEMVRAILAGRKTQTRRVIRRTHPGHLSRPACPFGSPGDKLWVRETFCIESNLETAPEYEPPFDDGRPVRRVDDEGEGSYWQQCHYRATDPTPEMDIGTGEPGVRWSPPIYMPRWASRITLKVTDVNVARVQEISVADACAEGVTLSRIAFARTWNLLNEKRGYGWNVNPWVWCLTFKRMTEMAACERTSPVAS